MLDLDAIADVPVQGLPFGVQKRVELARALACEPKLLLLDEPAAGLNSEEVDKLRAADRDGARPLRLTVLLVEHHMNLVMRVSDKVVALDFGRKIADGTPAEVQSTSRCHPRLSRGCSYDALFSRSPISTPSYGDDAVLHGVEPRRRGTRHHDAARRQWRRQDDDRCARSAT